MGLGSGPASASYFAVYDPDKWPRGCASVSLALSNDLWGFLLALTNCGLLVIGLSNFSPLIVTSVVDIYHSPAGSTAKH